MAMYYLFGTMRNFEHLLNPTTECHVAEGVMNIAQLVEELDPSIFRIEFDMIKYCRRKTTGIISIRLSSDKHQTMVNVYDGMFLLTNITTL